VKWIALAWMAALTLWSGAARAETRSICVFDPGGRSGDYFALMAKYKTNASTWGFDIEIRPYTDEETASKDYQAGACDGVVATGVRLQRFNRFASTIEAIGALPDYGALKQMVTALATSPSASAKLTQDGNSVVGFIPIGAVYLFVRDRNVDSVPELAGKRIATLDYDQPSVTMVGRVGSISVPANLGTLGPKFNNGEVDACYVSAPAYRPFELNRGIGTKGGILRYPLAQATLQVMLRESRFTPDFIAKSRKDLAARFDEALGIVQRAEAAIPATQWVDVPKATQGEWDNMFQSVRIKLRDEKKSYDGSMLNAMLKVRCGKDATRSECAEGKE
jgi:Family of unknown function (DUF6091)